MIDYAFLEDCAMMQLLSNNSTTLGSSKLMKPLMSLNSPTREKIEVIKAHLLIRVQRPRRTAVNKLMTAFQPSPSRYRGLAGPKFDDKWLPDRANSTVDEPLTLYSAVSSLANDISIVTISKLDKRNKHSKPPFDLQRLP